MAWSANKNKVLFKRAQNWAVSLKNLEEEAIRLRDIWQDEANGDAAHVDEPDVATVDELATLKNRMTQLHDFINNEAVSTVDRSTSLTPFLTDATA